MKKLRFWQKTYLLVLLLFVLVLFGGIAFIGWQTTRQSVDSAVSSLKQEQYFIAQNLSRDLSALNTGVPIGPLALIDSYGEYYAQAGVFLEIWEGEELLFSAFPEAQQGLINLQAQQGSQSWSQVLVGETRYLAVESALTESSQGYTLVCARSMEPLQARWDEMNRTLVLGSALVSVVLAVGLFFILRRLARPLEALAGTADAFSGGNFEARAPVGSTDEIGTLAQSFNKMADTAVQSIEEMSEVAHKHERMAASLSHEVRTPLTSIKGYAEYLLLAVPTEEERASALTYIISESDRLHEVAERMLQLFALEHEEIPQEPLDLADVAEESLRSLAPKARKAQVMLRAGALEHIKLRGDAILLQSLVSNLLDNAINACSPGGTVALELQKKEGRALLRVSDNGCGLSRDELEALGEPFYRPDKARSRKQGGAGLGVALCYRIALLHNAHLSYRSKLGEGTRATLEFVTRG